MRRSKVWEMVADWLAPRDPCPRCGSFRTSVKGIYAMRTDGKFKHFPVPQGRRLTYCIWCVECGLNSRKRGVPSWKHSQP
jgi:hypothetical protein